ncbi:MAG: hypothetical protein ABI376_04365 [Caulobacteraceae bacterium]
MMGNDPVMAHLPSLTLHILGGVIGLLSGYAAVLVAKGGRMHRLFGKVFVGSMALMATIAIYLAGMLTALKQQEQANIAVGSRVLYLILTSWMAVKRPPNTAGMFEKLALALVLAICATFLSWSLRATAPGGYDGYGPALYLVFGGVAALFGAFDVSMISRGGLEGGARIARHLGRMCTVLFIASASLFLGQQKVMPVWLHGSKVLLILAFLPLAFMVFWLVRVRKLSRFKRGVNTIAVSAKPVRAYRG